ncbi:MAG: family 20 glycosylhydrolase [Bacteroidia bacterium]|nr:family 20 glycosylhydrolase [Bacteroidia bacterium]
MNIFYCFSRLYYAKKFILFSLIILLFINAKSQSDLMLIPKPSISVLYDGHFVISSSTVCVIDNKSTVNSINLFNQYLKLYYGFTLEISKSKQITNNKITIEFLKDKPMGYYELVVGNEKIEIKGSEDGIFYAFQTLKQLISKNSSGKVELPCCLVHDYPRFSWRGMHLDVSRHFVAIDSVKRYIDYLASYKMNVFHWHLTDDQGWRIEIKKYPKLTQVGGYRSGTLIGSYSVTPQKFDTIRYGGYYTQQQIKEVVAYAKQRHVTIVPEIEMPGHAMAAISAYPELSCTKHKIEPSKLWGVFDDVFCANDSTIIFLTDVLTEVMDLFPGQYIHVGGDECPKTRWRVCKNCQAIIKREGLKDENELQSYFIKRIEKFVNSKGRKLIGWDEILEGGLAPNAAVMSWRGTQGGIDAAKQKHYVVMTPGSHCYFDHYQGSPKSEPLAIGGYTTVEKVYSFEPVPSELSNEESMYILGAQANVWTEYITSFKHVEYMIFPRICALSEVLWSKKEVRNWDEFKVRLTNHFKLLDKYGINYSKAMFEVVSTVSSETNGVSVNLKSGFADSRILYTLDNSEPDLNSAVFKDNIIINKDLTLKTACFDSQKQLSPVLEQAFIITKSTGKKITLAKEPNKVYNNGGAFTLVDGIIGKIPWYGKEWLGFSGENLEAIIDLQKEEVIQSVIVDVLLAESSWIYLPSSIEVLVSNDGGNYISVANADYEKIKNSGRAIKLFSTNSKARFVKVIVKNFGTIPEGKPGEGNKAWLFVDEIQIQ